MQNLFIEPLCSAYGHPSQDFIYCTVLQTHFCYNLFAIFCLCMILDLGAYKEVASKWVLFNFYNPWCLVMAQFQEKDLSKKNIAALQLKVCD